MNLLNLLPEIWQLIVNKLYDRDYLKFKQLSKFHRDLQLEINWSEQFNNRDNRYFELTASLISVGELESFSRINSIPNYINNIQNLHYIENVNLATLTNLTKLTCDGDSL